MRSVGVRELKQRASQVLRDLRDRGEEIEVMWSTLDRVARRTGAPRLARLAVAALLRLPGLRLMPVDDVLARTAAERASRVIEVLAPGSAT
jgi:hypothetical protein